MTDEPPTNDPWTPVVYDTLRELAQWFFHAEPAGHTLQPTALVHEAYLKLLGGDAGTFRSRGTFFRTASRAMRSVLVDMARARAAGKRGGGAKRIPLEDTDRAWTPSPGEVVAVHEALERLEAIDPEMAEVVELRFFAGLGSKEAAQAMGISERWFFRVWNHARAWLYRELHG